MKPYTVAWIVWILAFIVIESKAIARKAEGDTLSEHVWAILKYPPAWWVGAGFMVWLTGHFILRAKPATRF
jgi:hypothetical protein